MGKISVLLRELDKKDSFGLGKGFDWLKALSERG